MKIREYLLAATVIAVTGCSGIKNRSSTNELYLTKDGLKQLQPLEKEITQTGLKKLLGQKYTIRDGLYIKNEQLSKVFDILKEDQIVFSIFATEKGELIKLDIYSPEIMTVYHVQIGSKFSQIYEKAFGHCVRGSFDTEMTEVVCQAPDNKSIQFIFQGKWNGPKDLVPSDNILKDWAVTKITWSAKSSLD